MKQTLLSFIGLCAGALTMNAAHVTPQQAQQNAWLFVNQTAIKSGRQLTPSQQDITAVQQSDEANYYVFNVGDGQGFVIVSGDDRTATILGYCDHGQFDPQNIPDNMKGWLQGCSDAIGQIAAQNVSLAPVQPKASSRALRVARMPISPLLTSQWGQNGPYNFQTPVYDNKQELHCPTGCVATAMAQVMYYHKWPQSATTSIPSYTSKGTIGDLKMPELPATTFDWNKMNDTYAYTERTSAETDGEKEISKLLLYCGQSAYMDYGRTSSSATQTAAVDALKKYFDYDSNITIVNRTSYQYAEWINLIYDELANNRPVLLSGQSVGGGHSFVCDGYNEDDFFHINWGWSGMSDGFYKLSLLKPEEQGIGGSSTQDPYNLSLSAAIGIQPNTGQPAAVKPLTVAEIKTTNGDKSVTRSNSSRDFGVPLSISYYNLSGQKNTYDAGFGIYKDGELKEVITLEEGTSYDWGRGKNYSGTFQFGKDYENGEYVVYGVSRASGSDTWVKGAGSDLHYITATISGNTMTLNTVNESKVEKLKVNSVTFTGSKKTNESQTMTVNVTNEGTYFNGYLTMALNNQKKAGVQLEMEAGETRDVIFEFTPTVAGTVSYQIIQGFFDDGYPIAGGSETFSIGAEESMDVDLDIQTKVENVEKKNGQNYIYGSTMQVTVTATNDTETDYSGYINIQLCKWTNTDNGYSIKGEASRLPYIDVKHKSSKTVDVTFDELEEGAKYSIYVALYYYRNDDEYGWVEKQPVNSDTYIIKAGYNTYDKDGQLKPYEAMESINVPNVAVVDLRGQNTVKTIASQANPNTLFLLNSDQEAPAGAVNVVKGDVAENIVLTDGYDFYAPYAFTAENITYKRKFETGYASGAHGWETIMLPFDVESVTADGETIDWFHNASATDGRFWVMQFDGDNGTSNINYKHCEDFKAYVPYIIAVPGDAFGSRYDLTNKEIVFSGSNAKIRANKEGRTAISGTSFKMVGSQNTVCEDNIWTLDADGHEFVHGTAESKSFHAYIAACDITFDAPATLNITFNGNTATGINELKNAQRQQSDAVYNLNGVKVGQSLRHLPAGIYFQNGKKIIK